MLRRIAPCACFVADDYFGNTKEKHLGFPNVYKYNMVQTVKQAVQNHVTPVLPSLFGSNAFTTYSAFIRHLKLPARSSGPSAAVFSSAPLLLLRAGLGTQQRGQGGCCSSACATTHSLEPRASFGTLRAWAAPKRPGSYAKSAC